MRSPNSTSRPKSRSRPSNISTRPRSRKRTLRDPAYLASLRVADAFAHVLRVFKDETVPHEHGTVDPARDFDDVETELILSDMVVVEKRLDRVDKDRKKVPQSGSRQGVGTAHALQGSARSQHAAAQSGI